MNTPRVTIKWRENEPPYIEIWQGDTTGGNGVTILAGWLHETPDGPRHIAPIILPAEDLLPDIDIELC